MTVELREITPANRAEVEALRVAPGRERFVDDVKDSLEPAAVRPTAVPWRRARPRQRRAADHLPDAGALG